MATSLTNPTPAERAALAASTEFTSYVKTSMVAQAAAKYTSGLRSDNWNLYVYVQMAVLDAELNGAPLSERLTEVIAWHPAAPAAWFAAGFDFSTINAANLDTAVLTAFEIVAGL